jgi:hypothetical protein
MLILPARTSSSQVGVNRTLGSPVCFHYEFEHDIRGEGVDPDQDCRTPGCPSGPLPVPLTAGDKRSALVENPALLAFRVVVVAMVAT